MSEHEVELTSEEQRIKQALRQLWRELAEGDIELGTDWPYIARALFADLDDLAARLADAEARAEAAEAKVARVEALADRAEANRASHFDLDDCGCSMKDCYECGYWCRCTHTPWAAIREALRGDQ